MRFQYFKKMDELLGNKANISCPHSINTINYNETDSYNEVQSPVSMDQCTSNETILFTPSTSRSENDIVTNASENTVTTPTTSTSTSDVICNPTRNRKKRQNTQLESIRTKKHRNELQEAEWEKRRQYKREKDNIKIGLFEKKLELDERRVAALEALVKLKQASVE